jgi:hypothetical protein
VQDPDTAEAPVMPQAARLRCQPDLVLAPQAIAELLRSLAAPGSDASPSPSALPS